ncbi:cupin domain-containing protein [Streptomyces sp. NPDC051742]|uniref:cupin domain-containing protein n=1 Tax=unclassified Streptomyces TaxID=2593676 RepID=UPI003425D77E
MRSPTERQRTVVSSTWPGRSRRRTRSPRDSGCEWLYVLAGELRLILREREGTLRPGEVAELDTGEPHWFGPAGREAVEILHLFGPHGDQAVIRAGRTAGGSPRMWRSDEAQASAREGGRRTDDPRTPVSAAEGRAGHRGAVSAGFHPQAVSMPADSAAQSSEAR